MGRVDKVIDCAIGYRRLSKKDQSRYSLDNQDREIRKYCDSNELELIAIFTDNGRSSSTFDRPDYKALEIFIRKHKHCAKYLIVMSHDRFSRNLSEALSKINELQEKYDLKVLAVNEDVHLDINDPFVFIQRAFAYLLANEELLQIRKRSKDNIRFGQLAGRYMGRAPYGYLNSRDSDGRSILLMDESKAAVIKSIFSLFIRGKSIKEISDTTRLLGFKQTGNSAVQRILANPAYAGLIKVIDAKEGEPLIRGLHEPIVREQDYWLAQAALNKKRFRSQLSERFPLRGILKCSCGRNLTAGASKGRHKYYSYYYCLKHRISYRADILYEEFLRLLGYVRFNGSQRNKIAGDTKLLLNEALKDQHAIISHQEKHLAEIETKELHLDDLVLTKKIDGPTYSRLFEKLKKEKNALAEARVTAMDANTKFKQLEVILSKLVSMREVFTIASLIRKQSLISGLFYPSLIYDNGKFVAQQVNNAFISARMLNKARSLFSLAGHL